MKSLEQKLIKKSWKFWYSSSLVFIGHILQQLKEEVITTNNKNFMICAK